jgi:FADH2 O2-dependent halogenase
MINVTPYERLQPRGTHANIMPWSQGTLHHIFEGGWIWVIPFNNHRESTNPLVSVGLMLDRRKNPTPQGSPEEEFRAWVSRFPTVQKQFADARAVRPWMATGRIQYSQTQHVGHRWIQLPHAACFVDPLYSSGMSVLTVAIDLMGDALLRAFKDNDFAIERFQRVQDTVNGAFNHFDHVVTKSFDSFASYDLWNAWNRNWVMGNFLGTFGPFANLIRFLGTGDRTYLDRTTEPQNLGVLSSHLPEVKAAMMASGDDISAAIEGRVSHAEASKRIFDRLGALKFLPPYMGFGRPEQHAPSVFTLPLGARHVTWYRFQGDKKWMDYAVFSLMTYAWEVAKFAGRQTKETFSRFARAIRDIWFAGNEEWKYTPNALRAHRPWDSTPSEEPAALEARPPVEAA